MNNTKERIKIIKDKHDLTNTALAIKFGIPLRTVESWSAGKREAPPYLLNLIERTLKSEQRKTD